MDVSPAKVQAVDTLFTPPHTAHTGPFARVLDVYTAYQERRESLGLPNPGTVEGIAREVTRDVFGLAAAAAVLVHGAVRVAQGSLLRSCAACPS
jgi:hypothetical protein